jgi:hypothetical protein
MKAVTLNRCSFDEIFNFAGDVYGIDWNTANDVFYGNILTFRSFNEFEYGASELILNTRWAFTEWASRPIGEFPDALLRETYQEIYDRYKENRTPTRDEFYDVAIVLIGKFMAHHKVDTMFVDNS